MFKKIFMSNFKFNMFLQEYYKYIIAGIFVTVVDFSVLIFLTEYCNFYHMYSAAMAFVMASILHYYLSVSFVFKNRIFHKKGFEFLIFFIIGLLGLIFFLVFFYLFTDVIGVYYIFSKIFASGISFTFNFLARKILLFR